MRIQNALEYAGIEFIDENGGGPGVHTAPPTEETLKPAWRVRAARALEIQLGNTQKVLRDAPIYLSTKGLRI